MTRAHLAILSILVMAAIVPAQAASPSPSPPPASPATQEEGRVIDPVTQPKGLLALSRLTPAPGPLRLTTASRAADLFIPLVSTAVLKSAVVDIRYTNSIALLTKRSILEVRLNDTTLAQLHLDPQQPMGQASIRLPGELWHGGYNKLTFAVSQHYADDCENAEAPELWTEIDLSRSHLAYEVGQAERQARLSDLEGLFSPGLGGFGKIALLTAPDAAGTSTRAEALPLVAQALALRRQFEPLIVEHATWREPAAPVSAGQYQPDPAIAPGAHALIGSADQLARILPLAELPVIDGPKITIQRNQGHVRLIVTGRTDDEVLAAARGLGVLNDRLTPDRQVSFPGAPAPDTIKSLAGRQAMDGKRTYSFAALGTPDVTLSGAGRQQIRMNLPLPSDYYTEESATAEVLLDFGYGAGMGPGSIMNIMLNGEYVHGHGFDSPTGASYHAYRLYLPVRLMTPGVNTLDFSINARPPATGDKCAIQKGEHLFVQIQGRSTITLPAGGHVATLPDLARFAKTGFPYVTSGGDTSTTLVAASAEMIGPALTLIGKLAQVAHVPLKGWKLVVGLPESITQPAIVLATPQSLGSSQLTDWAATVGRTKRWPYRALNDLRALDETTHLTLDTVFDAVRGQQTTDAEDEQPLPTLLQKSDLGDEAVLMAFRNPQADGSQLLMVIAAETPATLAARMEELIQPELWSQMKGDLMAWQGLLSPLTIEVAEHYQVGPRNPWLLLRLTISDNPSYWLAGVGCIVALAAALSVLLLRRRTRHLGKGGR